MASALLLVPPLLKITHGPLLGPAMLVGAGRRVGHDIHLLDFNAQWIQEHLPSSSNELRRFVGDHDRLAAVSEMHRRFLRALSLDEPRESHEFVLHTARRLAYADFGSWILRRLIETTTRPDVLGVSVMYRDQVEPALAITIVARRLWPDTLVVWGGAHVTALRDDIANDARYGGEGSIDRFVFGYAEQTWVDVLDSVDAHRGLPPEAVCPGGGTWCPAIDDGSVAPVFDYLTSYDPVRLTLPAQASRGCIYGRCQFCTYPSIEGSPRMLPIEPIRSVIELAINRSAAVSFKDSLMSVERLDLVAELIAGCAPWSACTKLNALLDTARLKRLAAGGLATLEIGLETLDPAAQALIWKKQPESSFLRFLDAANAASVAVVVNYMTGLPNTDSASEATKLSVVQAALASRSTLISKLEHNEFQLECLSPMGIDPERHSIRVTRRAPWSTVMGWESFARLIPLGRRLG